MLQAEHWEKSDMGYLKWKRSISMDRHWLRWLEKVDKEEQERLNRRKANE